MSKADALRLPEYLGHIIEAIERIRRYVEDMSEVDFLSSTCAKKSNKLYSR